MISLLLWTLVTIWLFLVGGATYLAWRYYTTEQPAPSHARKAEARRAADRGRSSGPPPVVVPRAR